MLLPATVPSPTLDVPASGQRARRPTPLISAIASVLFAAPLLAISPPADDVVVAVMDASVEKLAADSTERLLVDLERVTDDLADFTARVVYENLDGLTEEAELRYGRVVYIRPKEARPRLAIILEEFVDSSGRKETIDQRYVFADGWLCDIDVARRQFIKRQISPPGSAEDPLRLGYGPFPLPVGQRRADVEERFVVEPAPPPSGRLAEGVAADSIRSMRLVPRAGTREAEQFRAIDLHYDRTTLLPVLVIALDPNGSVRTVRVSRAMQNTGIAPEDESLLSAQTPDPAEWTIDVRPWRD